MKPKKAIIEVRHVLWYNFMVCNGLRDTSIHEIQASLKKIRPALEKLYKGTLAVDDDHRVGLETYGYKSIEEIKRNLRYISDRWNCSYRIRWILDLIELDLSKLSDSIEKEQEYNEELL